MGLRNGCIAAAFGFQCTAGSPAGTGIIEGVTAVGFEPTPLRTGALSQRLRPLGQTVSPSGRFALRSSAAQSCGRMRGAPAGRFATCFANGASSRCSGGALSLDQLVAFRTRFAPTWSRCQGGAVKWFLRRVGFISRSCCRLRYLLLWLRHRGRQAGGIVSLPVVLQAQCAIRRRCLAVLLLSCRYALAAVGLRFINNLHFTGECGYQMTAVGFEPTPLRTGAWSQRLRPLGQTVSGAGWALEPVAQVRVGFVLRVWRRWVGVAHTATCAVWLRCRFAPLGPRSCFPTRTVRASIAQLVRA